MTGRLAWLAASAGLVVGAAAVARVLRRAHLRDVALGRLAGPAAATDGAAPETRAAAPVRSRLRRRNWTALLVGAAFAAGARWGAGWPWAYAGALGVVALTGAVQLGSWRLSVVSMRFEQQLADGIDMMVAAVKSGSSLQGALESAAENAERPWRDVLRELVGRIRLGDDPVAVLTDLDREVPLESMRLFAQTLAVNWTVGGRLAGTLANVGRTIRDRLELARRMHAMTTQARLSVASVVAVTYFIAVLMWRNDPDRTAAFLASTVGQGATAAAIVLQGLGIAWIARLSRPRF